MTNEELDAIRERVEKVSKGNMFREVEVLACNNSIVFEDVPKLLAEIERLRSVLNYINELGGEFYTEVERSEWDGSLTYSIPNTNPHKDTLQEIFVISYEAVNTDD